MVFNISVNASNKRRAKQFLKNNNCVDIDERVLNVPKLFCLNHVQVYNLGPYDGYNLTLSKGGSGLLNATFNLKVRETSIEAKRKTSPFRTIFYIIWGLICLYTLISGYFISDLYSGYQVEEGDYAILSMLILGLAVTMAPLVQWDLYTSKILRYYLIRNNISGKNKVFKDIEITDIEEADEDDDDDKEESSYMAPTVKKLSDIYSPKTITGDKDNPYRYLNDDSTLFFCSKEGIIQKTAFASLRFDDSFEEPREAIHSKYKIIAFLRELFRIRRYIKESECYDAICLLKKEEEGVDDTYYAYKDDGIVKVARAYEGFIGLKYNGETDPYGVLKVWISQEEPYLCFPGNEKKIVINKNWKNQVRSTVEDVVEEKKEAAKSSNAKTYVAIIVLFWAIIIGCSMFRHSPKPNDNYERILIEYDDENFVANDPNDSDDTVTDLYKWTARATSLYAWLNGGNPKYIAGTKMDTEYDIEMYRQFLANTWGIKSRADAKAKIDNAIKYGFRSKFINYVRTDSTVKKAIKQIREDYDGYPSFFEVQGITPEYFKEHGISTKDFLKVKAAACAYLRYDEEALDGYDYLRLMRVVYLCYKCGYLDQHEYLLLEGNLQRELKYGYLDYETIHESYYYGEMFRKAEDTDENNANVYQIWKLIKENANNGVYYKMDQEF